MRNLGRILRTSVKEHVVPSLFSCLSSGFWQRVLNLPIAIPFYHVVGDTTLPHVKYLYRFRSINEFKTDIEFFLRNFKLIDLRTLIESLKYGRRLPEYSMHLTFDDGFREMYDTVAPILKAKGIPATFFLTTAFLDNQALCHPEKSSLLTNYLAETADPIPDGEITAILNDHGVRDGDLKTRLLLVTYQQRQTLDEIAAFLGFDFAKYLREVRPYLTSEQVWAILKQGFTIGAHSIDHPRYETLSLEEQLRQTRKSICVLKEKFGLNYSAFAFPHSDDGVRMEFFSTLFAGGELDVSFGTGGMIKHFSPANLERFTMEKTALSAHKIVAKQQGRGLYHRLASQHATSV